MAKVIAFSGGCHSGKTTTINKIADILTVRGFVVKKLTEIMREITSMSIDELRQDPHEYLNVQETIISQKIDQEIEAFDDDSDTIYLVDRAITDSLFYLENYVDKSKLSEVEIRRLCNLDFVARQHAMSAFNCGYSMVVMFEPLDIVNKNDDIYRPENLDSLRDYEYQGINTLNRAYLWCKSDNYNYLQNFFIEVNMACNSSEFITDILTYHLYNGKFNN